MSDWSVTKAQAQKAAQQINSSGVRIREYAASFDMVRSNLLQSWEGSHKDLFAKETQNGFQQSAAALGVALLQLADMVQETTKQMVAKDSKAADAMNG